METNIEGQGGGDSAPSHYGHHFSVMASAFLLVVSIFSIFDNSLINAAGPATTPSWTVAGGQQQEYGDFSGLKYASLAHGDFNNDGYEDVVIGADAYHFEISRREWDNGGVFVWYGSANGPRSPGDLNTADWKAVQFNTNSGYSRLGNAVAAGDINGDGYDDLAVSAIAYDEEDIPNIPDPHGTVFVWYGSATGLGPNGTPANADWRANSDATIDPNNEGFGYDLEVGDVNGDGFGDLVVGDEDYFGIGRSAVFVWHGSATGLGPTGIPSVNADWSISDPAGRFGFSISLGDYNGDGYDDIAVPGLYYPSPTNYFFSTEYVWYGSATGLGPIGTTANADWKTDDPNTNLGGGPSFSGDYNGDGYDDLAVLSVFDTTTANYRTGASIWYGSATGLGPNGTAANADWKAEFLGSPQRAIYVENAGDVDGNRVDDLMISTVGSPDNAILGEGAAMIWYGSRSGLGSNGDFNNADWKVVGQTAGESLGAPLSSAGSVRGNECAGVLIKARNYFLSGGVEQIDGRVDLHETEPCVPPTVEKVSFTSNRTGNQDAFNVKDDGSELRNITNRSSSDQIVSTSGDKMWVLIKSTRDSAWGELYRMRADGSNVERITLNSSQEEGATLSFDGKKLAYGVDGNIYVTDLSVTPHTTTNVSLLPTRYDSDPSWNSNGSKLVFSSQHGIAVGEPGPNRTDLYVVDVSIPTRPVNYFRLTNTEAQDVLPVWSRDDAWIAFLSNKDTDVITRNGNHLYDTMKVEVFLVRPSGGTVYKVPNSSSLTRNKLAWNPGHIFNGLNFDNALAMVNSNSSLDLYLQQVPNTFPSTSLPPKIPIARDIVGNEKDPSWSTDGSKLVYTIDTPPIYSTDTSMVWVREVYKLPGRSNNVSTPINLSNEANADDQVPFWVKVIE